MNEAEQQRQQARGDAIDNLVRALFVARVQCSSLGQFRDMVADIAWGVAWLYQTGVRDAEEIIKGMTDIERMHAAEEV